MPSLPPSGLPLLTGAQAGAADEAAVAAGETWDGLLARAGGALARGVVDVLRARRGGVSGRRVVVAVGKGDNGGDGWVCATRLRDRGAAVTVLAVHGPDADLSPHSGRARAAWLSSGGRVVTDPTLLDDVARAAEHGPALVDCLLGTGATGAPRGPVAEAVRRIARAPLAPVIACDIPSGVDADTGVVADEAAVVHADLTVTFGAAKRGLVLHPGAGHVGRLVVAGLGPHWSPRVGDEPTWWATGDRAAAPTPWEPHDDKRSRGRVVVLAGSRRYGGAAVLAAAAACRAGAGLVTLCTTAPAIPVLAREPAVMVTALPAAEDDTGGPAAAAIDTVLAAVRDADAIVVGPGLGHADTTRTVVEAVLRAPADGAPRPVVLDADGCNVYRGDVDALAGHDGVRLVLTPHERELARLLGRPVEDVARDRHGAAAEVAARTGATVLAKGPSSLVVHDQVPTAVVSSGGPALGTGGTGDVLAGMLGAALARVRGSVVARRPVGVVAGTAHLHGLVGARAGAASGGRTTATDLLDHLPATMATLAARFATEGDA